MTNITWRRCPAFQPSFRITKEEILRSIVFLLETNGKYSQRITKCIQSIKYVQVFRISLYIKKKFTQWKEYPCYKVDITFSSQRFILIIPQTLHFNCKKKGTEHYQSHGQPSFYHPSLYHSLFQNHNHQGFG